MSKSQGTGIVLLVVPQHLGANNAVKPTAYGGGLLLTLVFKGESVYGSSGDEERR